MPGRPDALLNGGSLPMPTQNATYLLSIISDTASFIPGNLVDTGPVPQRRAHAVAITGTTAYVFGGIVLGGDQELADVTSSAILNDMWKYDMTTLKWSVVNTTGDVPPACYGHTFTMVRPDMLVLIGGLTRPGVASMQDIWVFTPSTSSWQLKKASGDLPLARRWHTATPKNSNIIIYGGSSADQKTDYAQVGVLDTDLWKWTLPKVGDGVKGRRSHTAHLVQGQLLIVFGYSDETKQPASPSLLVIDTDKWYYSSWLNPSSDVASQEAQAAAEKLKKNTIGASVIVVMVGGAVALSLVTIGVIYIRRRNKRKRLVDAEFSDQTALMDPYGVRVPTKAVLRHDSGLLDAHQSTTERKSKAGFMWFEEGQGGKSGAKVRKLLGVEQS